MVLSTVRLLVPAESYDLTEPKAALLEVGQVVPATVGFGLILWAVAATRLVTPDPDPGSKLLAVLLGVGPGLALGVGVPAVAQCRGIIERVGDSLVATAVGAAVTFGTYALLIVAEPAGVVSAVLYAFTYVASRTVTVVGIYGGAQVRAALA